MAGGSLGVAWVCSLRCRTEPFSEDGRGGDSPRKQHLSHADTTSYQTEVGTFLVILCIIMRVYVECSWICSLDCLLGVRVDNTMQIVGTILEVFGVCIDITLWVGISFLQRENLCRSYLLSRVLREHFTRFSRWKRLSHLLAV